jgi:hypothetical protein
MKKARKKSADINRGVVMAVAAATDTKPRKGEDLIFDFEEAGL